MKTVTIWSSWPRVVIFVVAISHLVFAAGAVAQSCTNSNTDENIIEYFNMINYMGDFEIKTKFPSNATVAEVTIICPERESTDIPPLDFRLELHTATTNLTTDCYSDTPIEISPDAPDCRSNGACTVLIVANNASTAKVYSQTELEIFPFSEPLTFSDPELNPATLPICLSSVVPCLKASTCAIAENNSLSLSLLDENKKYSYDEQINFTLTN